MTQIRAEFSIDDFENYGTVSSFLSQEQEEQVVAVDNRTNSQLDWVAQLLGWRGDSYWDGLVSQVAQKRRMLGGSFGVYNGYLYPRVLEIRNWENTIVVEKDPRLLQLQAVYVNDIAYFPTGVTENAGSYSIQFENLPDSFYNDVGNNFQIKVYSPPALPYPFYRPAPETSGNAYFTCKQSETSLTLYPYYDTQQTTPYKFNFFIKGSRYYFDKPLTLTITNAIVVKPVYDLEQELWYIDIPSEDNNITASLSYQGSSLSVSLIKWRDPSDWVNKNTIDNFKGVWNNKGGFLPFHFVFDALEIHGFNEKQSLFLENFERRISFDRLLESVYFQKANISANDPSGRETSQVWWNPQNGSFSVHIGDSLNCGPWVEVNYPKPWETGLKPDYVFPNVEQFEIYSISIPEGCLVVIEDITDLNPELGIIGLKSSLSGPGSAYLVKKEKSEYWTSLGFEFDNISDFAQNATDIPVLVRVLLKNSIGLSPETPVYTVANLQFIIEEQLPLDLMKDSLGSAWYISPPTTLKYIGNTRLFASSLNYNNPVEGEINWDYENPYPPGRGARVFYYNRWVQDPLTDEWTLEGDWVGFNSKIPDSVVPEVVDFGTILVYCNGVSVELGSSYRTDDFQLDYDVDLNTGELIFKYSTFSYEGVVNTPQIVISDSLTSAFRENISSQVFSGLTYYMSPNILDSETLLRIWKSRNLSVIESLGEYELLRNPNPLIADQNEGPADSNWERYFVRLPPAYGRNDNIWQKVSIICQNFGYWGSPVSPEAMECPPEKQVPRIYEEVHLYGQRPDSPTYLYSEPYLFSDVVFNYSDKGDDYANSCILPVSDIPYDEFVEGDIKSYYPLHERKADVSLPTGRGYGEWEGAYYRASPCENISGFLQEDLLDGAVEPIQAPFWDSSIYKLPWLCGEQQSSSTVDANHYKIGYAFFAADLSAAEDGVFDLNAPG